MRPLEWSFLDRTGWGEGPWDGEPDKIQWVSASTGLPCLMHRGFSGGWCGYVGVAPSHPAYKRGYQDVDVDVHGGLTFAASCDPKHDALTGQGICHVPEPGEPDDVWWLGFDCAHAGDLAPALNARLSEVVSLPRWLRGRDDVYCDRAYVQAEVERLAAQLLVLAAP